MKYVNNTFNSLLVNQLDGFPIPFTSKCLPLKTYFNSSTFLHIHAHAKKIISSEQLTKTNLYQKPLPKKKLLQIIEHLYDHIASLKLPKQSHWNKYYQECHYNEVSIQNKIEFIEQSITTIDTEQILDIGCNEGLFSKKIAEKVPYLIAIDNDERVIDSLYRNSKNFSNILPLCIDITKPSPTLGWKNKERKSFLERLGNNNVTLALAVIHHLRIAHNIPISELASFFSTISKQLIIEFIPKTDPQAQRLLRNKTDIYNDYILEVFLKEFSKYFHIIEYRQLNQSERTLINFIRI